jgi:hypothetical protein
LGRVEGASALHSTTRSRAGAFSIGYRVLTAHLLPGPAAARWQPIVDSRASALRMSAEGRVTRKAYEEWIDMARPRKGLLRERSHVMILPASAAGAGPVNAVPGHGFAIAVPMWGGGV